MSLQDHSKLVSKGIDHSVPWCTFEEPLFKDYNFIHLDTWLGAWAGAGLLLPDASLAQPSPSKIYSLKYS